ncbi:hypothetical protein ACP4OV_016442 [Aristida adscensionis]
MGSSALLVCVAATVVTILVAFVMMPRYKGRRRSRVSSESSSCLPLPPGPKGLPLLGSLLYFVGPLRSNPHRGLAALAQAYGHVASLRLAAGRRVVVVSSPAMAREALAKNDAALAARFVPDNVRAMSHGASSLLFLPSSSALWRQHRAVVGARFSSGLGLDMTRPIRERHARRLSEHVRAAACSGAGGAGVDVREAVHGTVLNVISNILFSRDVVGLDLMRVRGAQVFRSLMAPVLQEWSRPNLSDALPFLAPLDLLGSRRRISKPLAQLYSFFDQEVIQPRLASGDTHNDLLGVVLARHAKSKITRLDITRFLTDMFIAATDTSTVTVQWAMVRLLCHPEKMEKVSAEVAARLGPNDFVQESDLDKLPYLHAVIKETLRLHPAVPLIPREVVEDGVSLGGYAVPVGTAVVVNLWAIGRDPRVWDQPEEFMPERFLVEEAVMHAKAMDFTYRPFGAGRRVCPGMDYAARSVPLLLASILHKVRWRLPDGMAPSDLDLRDRYGTVLELATPLFAVPVPVPAA